MLTIHRENNKPLISLFELYLRLGREPKRFYPWKKRYIYSNITLEQDLDYFPTKRGFVEPDKKGRPRQDYLITITMAKALCINSGTVAGKKAKKFIEAKEKEVRS